MKDIKNEVELKEALKANEKDIRILGPYAQEVFDKYSKELHEKAIPMSPLLAAIGVVGNPLVLGPAVLLAALTKKNYSISRILPFFKVVSYKENELVLSYDLSKR